MKLTPLGRRLAHVARSPETPWRVLAENVPMWPSPPQPPSSDGDYRYAPSQGEEALLNALRKREQANGIEVGTESILVTNGALDALGLAARHLAASGARRAICAGPVLLSIADLFRAVGLDIVVRDWETLIGGRGWTDLHLGPDDILYLNTPHNPTAACVDETTTRELLAAQRERGFTLLFDLVYDSFVHARTALASPLALVTDWHGIYGVNSFSKNYGAPGLRVGWLVAEPTAVEQLTARVEWERIAVSTDAQHRAAWLCGYGNAPLVERVAAGRRIVLRWADEHGIQVSSPQGGTHVWADLGVADAEELADQLMLEHGLIVTTGANYHPASPSCLRIPTGVPPSFLTETLPMIVEARRARGMVDAGRWRTE